MDGAPTTYVSLLDGFALRLEARRCLAEDMPRGLQRLGAYLCLSRSTTRSVAVGRLWPDVPEARAHADLRSALWRLQKVVPGLVTATRENVSPPESVQVDVRELVAWARQAMNPATPVDEVLPGSRQWPGNCCRAGMTTGCSWSASGCGSCGCTPSRHWRRSSPPQGGSARPPTRRTGR